jgi:hypothetical protein
MDGVEDNAIVHINNPDGRGLLYVYEFRDRQLLPEILVLSR